MSDEQTKTIIDKTSGFQLQTDNFKNFKRLAHLAALKVLYPTVVSEDPVIVLVDGKKWGRERGGGGECHLQILHLHF